MSTREQEIPTLDQLLGRTPTRSAPPVNNQPTGPASPLEQLSAQTSTLRQLLPTNEERMEKGDFSFSALAQGFNNPIQLARAVSAGVLAEGIAKPLESIFTLPGLGWEAGADFMERAQVGLYSALEETSRVAGMTDDEIASQKVFGDFVGFILPAVLSVGIVNAGLKGMAAIGGIQRAGSAIKGVNALARPLSTMDAVRRYPLTGGFVNEAIAGAFYGGILVKPEEGTNRLNNALKEAAFFGLGRTVFNVPAWLGYHRLNYLRVRSSTIDDVIKGADGAGAAETLRNQVVKDDVFKAYSELEAIESSTNAVMEYAESGDNLKSLLIALRDTQLNGKGRSRTTVELSLDPGKTMGNITDEMSRLRDVFGENFSMRSIFNPHTGIDELHVAPRGKGLTNAEAKAKRETGFYDGEFVMFDGGEGTFVSMVEREFAGNDFIQNIMTVRARNGRTFEINASSARTAFTSADVIPLSRRADELFAGFRSTADEMFEGLRTGQTSLTERQAADLAQASTLDLGDGKYLESVQTPGTVAYPQEIGAAPNGLPKEVEAARQQLKALVQENNEKIQAIMQQGDETPEVQQMIEQLIQEVQEARGRIQHMEITTPEGIAADIAEAGFASSRLNSTFEDIPLGQIFDDWATPFAFSEGEHLALKGAFIRKYADDLMASVPDVDRAMYDRIQAEYAAKVLKAGVEVDIELVGAQVGVQVFVNPERTKFVLRDRMSGAEWIRESAGEARTVLRNFRRESPDFAMNEIPLDNMGMSPAYSNRSTPDYIMKTTDDYVFGTIAEEKNTNILTTVEGYFRNAEGASKMPFHTVANTIARKSAIGQQGALVIRKSMQGILNPVLGRRGLKAAGLNLDDMGTAWSQLDQLPDFHTMTPDQMGAALKDLGWDDGMVHAMKEMDRALNIMDDRLADFEGTGRQFMGNYYGHSRPQTEALGVVPNLEVFAGREGDNFMSWMLENSRVGRLSRTDHNPQLVLDKLIEQIYVTERILPDLRVMDELGEITMKQISPEQADIVRASGPRGASLGPDDLVVNETMREVISRFTNHYTMSTQVDYKSTTAFMNNFFGLLGVKISNSTVEKFIQTSAQLMYGSTLGARAGPIVLNSMQVTSIGTPLWGQAHMANGLEIGLSKVGFNRAKNAGSMIPERRRFTDGDDRAFDALQSSITTDGTAKSRMAANIMHGVAWSGDKLKSLADAALIPFGHMDEVNRSIAFNAQVSVGESTLNQLGGRARVLGSEALQKEFADIAMIGHSETVRRQFFEQMSAFGDYAAMDYLGVEGSKFINFSYGQGLGPLATQTGWGRLFGMFGSHPVWMTNYSREVLKNSTMKQKAVVATRSAALMGAIGIVSHEYGFNPVKYLPIGFVGYTGAPALDVVTNGIGVVTAPWPTKGATARALLKTAIPLAVPGMISAKEVGRAFRESGGLDPNGNANAGYMAISLMFSRPDFRPLADYSIGNRFIDVDPQFLIKPETMNLLGNPAMKREDLRLGMQQLQDIRGNTGLPANQEDAIRFNR